MAGSQYFFFLLASFLRSGSEEHDIWNSIFNEAKKNFFQKKNCSLLNTKYLPLFFCTYLGRFYFYICVFDSSSIVVRLMMLTKFS